ncbi:MAG: ATP synthase F1 subunit gamma [Myxococcales bacterium]|nr:ATP synthase F1 subunit gamma [Myxococcales bacterium]
MGSLKHIRSRIKSVENTQKITKAMKLVAAARLRRAQDAATAARPYAAKMREVIASLVAEVEPDSNPLFQKAETPRTLLLVPMTSDRGLCGAFNSSLLRRVEKLLREQGAAYQQIRVASVGRKGRTYFRRRDVNADVDTASLVAGANQASAATFAKELVRLFSETEVDEVWLVYNEFKSALTQIVTVEPLLPLSPESFAVGDASATESENVAPERLYEPGRQQLLDALLPRYIESQILRSLLESQASEMGARMTAMDNASRNAKELIVKLKLDMNRARQSAITTELMEITAGAEALKG